MCQKRKTWTWGEVVCPTRAGMEAAFLGFLMNELDNVGEDLVGPAGKRYVVEVAVRIVKL